MILLEFFLTSANLIGLKWYLTEFLICLFLVTNIIENLSYIYGPFTFPLPWNDFFFSACFLLASLSWCNWFTEFLYILALNLLTLNCFTVISFQVVSHLFTFLWVSDGYKFTFYGSLIYTSFSLWFVAVFVCDSCLRRSSFPWGHEGIPP